MGSAGGIDLTFGSMTPILVPITADLWSGQACGSNKGGLLAKEKNCKEEDDKEKDHFIREEFCCACFEKEEHKEIIQEGCEKNHKESGQEGYKEGGEESDQEKSNEEKGCQEINQEDFYRKSTGEEKHEKSGKENIKEEHRSTCSEDFEEEGY